MEKRFFPIMTTNSKLWVRKERFGITFLEEALSEEQLVRKIGKKTEEEAIRKKVIRKILRRRYEGVPRTDGRKSSNLPSNTDLV